MKPSEVGNFRKSPYYYQYSTSGSGWFDTVYLYEVTKSRDPMSYEPKEFVNIGIGQQLRNRSYRAFIHDKKWPTIKQTSFTDGTRKNYNAAVDRRTTHQYLSPPTWVLLMEANAINQLTVEFLNKIQERKLSLVEETANFKESIKTIASSAERLVWYGKQMFANPRKWLKKAYRKRDLQGGRVTGHRMIKSYGDLWLEGRYHWLPTYMTMRDAFIGLQDLIPGLPVTKKGPGMSADYELSETHGFYRDSRVLWSVECSLQHKMGCFITANSEAAALARRYGVGGVADLAAVAWELTPWTLVFDWIVPVSDVLLAHNALTGLTAHNPYQVEKRIRSGYCAATPPESTLGTVYESIQDGEIWYEEYNRNTSSVSSLSPRLFLADEIVNARRIVDSLSFFSGSKMGKKVISGRI